MIGKMNNKKAIKVISIVLSVYMAFSPMAVYADEVSEAESSLAEQTEEKEKAAESVDQAVDNMVESEESYSSFEKTVDRFDNSGITFENVVTDTSNPIEEQISNIENEAIEEVVSSITDLDMTNKVDNAFEKIDELVDEAITDEVVASEIEATADTLIAFYDTQAAVALNALTTMNVATVSDNGTVAVDWQAATDDVIALYGEYQKAIEARDKAQELKDKTAADKEALLENVDTNALNKAALDKNKETITNSKKDKNDTINELIASVAKAETTVIEKKCTVDGYIDGSADIYRFYINTVDKDGTAYGCLTYYDSARKTILRKNFKITADEIDYSYVPKPEWVKNDKDCKEEIFGNGGNYIAACVENKVKDYINSSDNTFKGVDVSNVMRANVTLNNNIDAFDKLEEIKAILNDAESDLKAASDDVTRTLENYKNAVEMYRKAAALESEVRKSEVEKAKLEYVKAEIEVRRRQQALNQIKEAINNVSTSEKKEAVNSEAEENIETIVNSIAINLGVKPEAVEGLVVQAIIDAEENANDEVNGEVEASVAGARRNNIEAVAKTEETETAEEIENVKLATETESTGEIINPLNEAQKIVTIEENQIPYANIGADFGHSVNWLPLILAFVFVAWMLFVIIKNNQKEEEAKA